MGAAGVATVTTLGVQATVLAERRTSFVGALAEALLALVMAGRGEDSATWTAPPPMIAPPQAHAHNFAKAIRTDIFQHFLVVAPCDRQAPPTVTHPIFAKVQKKALTATGLTVNPGLTAAD
jgi:hypothetical protein